jgi:RHS repeat-associated protein
LTDSTIRNQVNGIIGGNRTTYGFRYTYNDGGMVTRMEYPDGAVHTYTYDDNLGRLQRIGEGAQGSAPTDFVYGLEYNRSGVVTRMNYANGTTQRWGFDNRKRIAAISITGPAGVIENLAYRYDGGGNLLSINDNEYVYDGFGRIAGARTLIPGQIDHYKLVEESFGTYQAGDPINGAVFNPLADLNGDGRISGADHSIASFEDEGEQYDIESFTYDRNGNRTLLIQNDDEYTYEYDLAKNNQLKKVYVKKAGTTTRKLFAEYFYDANGNTVKRVIHKPEGPETVTFAYDTMNRVVMTQNGPRTIEYTYDNAGNRLYKKESGGALTVYFRHGQIAVAMDIELTPESTTERGSSNRYLLSGDLLAGRVTTTRNLDGTTAAQKSWYHLDHLNSTKCITDAAGVIEVNYTYRAFGEQLRRLAADGTPTEDAAKYSYGGKELDEEIGLYYFNARYYDATLGRFISLDPVQDGSNWYVYCSNNPLCFVDPTGLIEIESPAAKEKDPNGKDRGYKVTISDYHLNAVNFYIEIIRTYCPIILSDDKRSRSESGIPNDTGRSHIRGLTPGYHDTFLFNGNEEKLGPVADKMTMSLYQKAFGGEIIDGTLYTPKDHSYKEVRNRIGYIWGIVSYFVGDHGINGSGPVYADGLSVGKEKDNLSDEDIETIDNVLKSSLEETSTKFRPDEKKE